MFWACFSGTRKGPCVIWDRRDWGNINSQSYYDHIIPLIDGWLTLHPDLVLMQDNASPYTSRFTKEELRERGIEPIDWPAFSPDLNPTEHVWAWMKDFIQENYP